MVKTKFSQKTKKAQASLEKKQQQAANMVNNAAASVNNVTDKVSQGINQATSMVNNAVGTARSAALAVVDAAQAAINIAEKFLAALKFENDGCDVLDFLLSLLGENMNSEEIASWLTDMVLDVVPELENTIKEAILTEIKAKIDCSLDPNIPKYLRKKTSIEKDGTRRGIDINIRNLDYRNIFQVSPMSFEGNTAYFGAKTVYRITDNLWREQSEVFYSYKDASDSLDSHGWTNGKILDYSEISSIYELVRARDMNAFLWYAISHSTGVNEKNINGNPKDWNFESETMLQSNTHGEIPEALTAPNTYTLGDVINHNYGSASTCNKSMVIWQKEEVIETKKSPFEGLDNILDEISGTAKSQGLNIDPSSYESIAVDKISSMASTLFKKYKVKSVTSVTVPYSDTFLSYNWYSNRAYVQNMITGGSADERDFDEDTALFNIAYENRNTNPYSVNSTYEGVLHFTILPKPFQYSLDGKTVVNAVFDATGQKLTSNRTAYTVRTKEKTTDGYKLYTVDGEESECELKINSDGYTLEGDSESINRCLFPCFKGTSYYDFCREYLYGMQILDPIVISAELLKYLTGGVNEENTNQLMVEASINSMIANLISSIDGSSPRNELDRIAPEYMSDQSYAEALAEADRKRLLRANTSAYSALNACNDKSTTLEKKGALKASFNEIASSLSTNDSTAKVALMQQILSAFTNSVIRYVLSPKVLMLLEINRKVLMDDDTIGTNSNINALISAIRDTIANITVSIQDTIMKKLSDKVGELLLELITKFAAVIAKEQVEAHMSVIKSAIPFAKKVF